VLNLLFEVGFTIISSSEEWPRAADHRAPQAAIRVEAFHQKQNGSLLRMSTALAIGSIIEAAPPLASLRL
jgi:hypothetical protein